MYCRTLPPAVLGLSILSLQLLFSGCSLYGQLTPEAEIPDLAPLVRAAREMSSQTGRYVVATSAGKPIRVAVEEKGAGDDSQVIVFVHGVFADRSMWRFIVGDLGRDHRIVLVDLPGSGDSDKPNPKMVGDDFYAPDSMARAVLEALRQHFEPRLPGLRITLVGHSLGGMVVQRMLANPELGRDYAGVRHAVDRVVLLSPLDVLVVRQWQDYKDLANLGDAKAILAKILGMLRRRCAAATHGFSIDASRMPREEADRLIRILSDARTRHAHQAMLRRALPFHPDGHPDFERMFEMTRDYRNIDVPCLILWGRRDEHLPVSMGYRMVSHLPQAWLRILPSCTHATPCERPVLFSALTRSFVHTGRPMFAVQSGTPEAETAQVNDLLPEWMAVEAAFPVTSVATQSQHGAKTCPNGY